MSTYKSPDAAPGCARVCQRLIELLDGGLPAGEAARDEGHLEACAACEVERARLEAWLSGLRAAVLPSPSELLSASAGLEARLARVPAPQPALSLRRGGSMPLAASAAVCLAASALLALALLRGLGMVHIPAGGSVGGALENLGRGSLPSLNWPTGSGDLWMRG